MVETGTKERGHEDQASPTKVTGQAAEGHNPACQAELLRREDLAPPRSYYTGQGWIYGET
jgi:hypothetical protein